MIIIIIIIILIIIIIGGAPGGRGVAAHLVPAHLLLHSPAAHSIVLNLI